MKRRIRIAAQVTVALLTAGLTGEAAVRWLTPFSLTTPRMFAVGDAIPWQLRPNVRTVHESYWGDFHVTVETNSLGFRDREISREKPPGVFRILALGDSFTFGVGVEGHEAYPKVLEALLNQHAGAGRHVEVVNAGFASGYAPDTAFVFFRRTGVSLNPDLVLLGYFSGNDVADVSSSRWPELDEGRWPLRVTTDLYYVDSLGRLRTAPWLGILGGEEQHGLLRPWYALKVAIRDHCQFANFLVQRYRLFMLGRKGHAAGVPEGWLEEPVSDAEARIERVLEGLEALTASQGSRLTLVHIPTKEALRIGKVQADEVMRHWCTSRAGRCIDLLEAPLPGDPKELYLPVDSHWNARGHAWAAEVIAARLVHEVGLRR